MRRPCVCSRFAAHLLPRIIAIELFSLSPAAARHAMCTLRLLRA
jgi:hypothetical protein